MPGLIALVSIIAGLTGAFGSFSAPLVLDLVDPGRLTKANGAMAGVAHLSTIAGPGIFGLLLQFLAMPLVLVVDAISYFVSAFLILPLRQRALPRTQVRVPAPAFEASGMCSAGISGSIWRVPRSSA
nr:hypothetical protein [Nonomuraea sp. WAC 01424]